MSPEESAEILKLATTVGGVNARLDAIEKARTLARGEDHEWRAGIAKDIDIIKACMTEMPCLMDAKIAHCRDERVAVTSEAVALVHDTKAFAFVVLKLAGAAGVITAAVFGVGRLFGWI